jgi:hypothetical protein
LITNCLLDFVHRPDKIEKYIKSRRFGGWFFFRLQVKGGETPEDGRRSSLRNDVILYIFVFYPDDGQSQEDN